MSRSFLPIIQKFFKRVEKDADFFSYYNVTLDEAMQLAKQQALNYLIEAIENLTYECTPEINFYDYDEELQEFGFQVTKKEQGLLADLMREVYFDRDLSLLKAFKVAMTPSDMNQFSPASERKTFTDMLKNIKTENKTKISQYIAEDRLTRTQKYIEYGKYQD